MTAHRIAPIMGAFVDTMKRAHAPRKPVDLIAELLTCAAHLESAARLTEDAYPDTAKQFALLARRARSQAAIALEVDHVRT